MLTLPETTPRRHRLSIADFAVETFAPLDDTPTPGRWRAVGTTHPAAGCGGGCDNGGSNQNNCKTCNTCNSDGNCSNPVGPGGN